MRPGCQEKLNHVFFPDPTVSDHRFCISFRKVMGITVIPITGDTVVPHESIEPPATVLIGTSIKKRIDLAKIVEKTSTN
jgi:hypothetical protein